MTKRLRIIYVGATFVLLVLQGYEATEYLAKAPGVLESFGSLGLSGGVLQCLGGIKLLGITALALASSIALKQLAHAAFALSAVGALVSHLGARDPFVSLLPVLVLLIAQLVSYSAWRLWLHRVALRRRYYYLDEAGSDAVETRT